MATNHFGIETVIVIGGREYILSRFTRKLLREFLDWANEQLPNPLEIVKSQLDGFPLNIQELLVKDALAAARTRLSLASPEVQSLLASPEGCGKIITLLFSEHQPHLSDDDCWQLFEQARAEHGDDHMQEVIARCSGTVPISDSQREEEAFQAAGLLDQSGKKKF